MKSKPKSYKFNLDKLTYSSQSLLPKILAAGVEISDDSEFFEDLKPLLEIPEQPKSLEDLSKELDSAFEGLVKSVRSRHEVLQGRLDNKFAGLANKQRREFARMGSGSLLSTCGTLGITAANTSLTCYNGIIGSKPDIGLCLNGGTNWFRRKLIETLFQVKWDGTKWVNR